MNSVILIGRLTKDPEVRYTQSQLAVCRFTLAIDRLIKDGETKTDFPNVIVYGKTAENCERYLSKGRQVAVQGRLQTGSYEKDGHKIYTTDVIADRIEFIGSKGESTKPAEPSGFKNVDDDIPF